jgi:hypothetical protein
MASAFSTLAPESRSFTERILGCEKRRRSSSLALSHKQSKSIPRLVANSGNRITVIVAHPSREPVASVRDFDLTRRLYWGDLLQISLPNETRAPIPRSTAVCSGKKQPPELLALFHAPDSDNCSRSYKNAGLNCARRGSNPQPLAPEANALSS